MINSTFGSFVIARLGMSASQKSLSVVGQNISNISTPGYTRQRVDQVSINVGGIGDKYAANPLTNIGNGVMVTGVSQLRDPFLDRRFRTEMAQVGECDVWVSGLDELASILDETSMKEDGGGINNQLGDLLSKLNDLSNNVGSNEYDNMVKSSANVLVKLFNSYAQQINTVRDNLETDLKDVDITAVNNILKNIQELNVSIKNSQIHGDDALELQDQRNTLIDELATYVNIDVKYDTVQVTDATSVEELSIKLVGKDGNKIDLINDEQMRQFTVSKDGNTGEWSIGLTKLPVDKELQVALNNAEKAYKEAKAAADAEPGNTDLQDAAKKALDAFNKVKADVTAAETAGAEIDNINDELTTGSLKSSLSLLNGNGEFDPNNPNAPKGIGYYEKSLDLLANKFAEAFNKANTLDGKVPGVENNVLFVANAVDPNAPITAGNIKIADGWANNDYGITTSKEVNANGKPTVVGANDNIVDMIAMMKESIKYTTDGTVNGEKIFEGTFQEYFVNIGTVLGLDISSSNQILNNHTTLASDINQSRDSVSGVSLDEEGMNMIQFSQAYNASARFMTVLDEALDTLINNMGVVGR